MSGKVLVFGGTTEGRELSDYLRKVRISHVVSVATEYGEEILKENGESDLLVGRRDADDIAEVLRNGEFSVVIDSTHPFATAASAQIKKACEMTGTKYLRLARNTDTSYAAKDMAVFVDSIDDAIAQLNKTDGVILLLTGSRDLDRITGGLSDIGRVYARVLPNEDSIRKCTAAGLKGKQIIAMQGPFSKQMNVALIKEVGATVILTKESGETGGFDEKLEAAAECLVKAVVVRNPEKQNGDREAYSLNDVIEYLEDTFEIESGSDKSLSPQNNKSIVLAGIGPGDERYYTNELISALEKADVLFGAETVVSRVNKETAPKVPMYQGDEIFSYLEENSNYTNPVVLFSGDISLCSGAKKAAELFRKKGYRVDTISGISSVTLFARALGISLEDATIVSAHGRECNVVGYAFENENLIILPSGPSHADSICKELSRFADRIVIGYELGTVDEKVMEYSSCISEPAKLQGKCIIYVHNQNAKYSSALRGLSDDAFIRGKTPMTKEEIRALSIRKLKLTRNAVLYDIGAGTGSVSVEAALQSPDIKVYSIEKNEEAVSLLKQNKEKFGITNLEITTGTAPEALGELPIPSHVFIGGSGGNMADILKLIFEMNNEARIVINCVTVETFTEVMKCVGDFDDIEPDIIQVGVTRFKKVGKYHMADAINPVYIISLQREVKHG